MFHSRSLARRVTGIALLPCVLACLAPAASRGSAAHDAHRSRRVADPARDTLAWAAGHAITADDLLRRIELMPWAEKQGPARMDTARVRALQSLVGERLLAREAEREGVGDTGSMARAGESLRRALARDALYRHVTRAAEAPTAAAIDRAVRARAPGASPATRATLRRTVADSLRNLAQRERAGEFLHETLGGRRATVDSTTLWMLADTLRGLMETHPRESGGAANGVGEYADLLLDRLAAMNDRTLVRLPDGRWTLGEAIESMRFYSFIIHARTPRGFAAELSARLRELVEGEMLAREGLRRGLDRAPDVRDEVDRWRCAWRAQTMLQRVSAGPPASEDDAFRLLALEDPDRARAACEVDVREILSESRERGEAVRARLEAGADFDSLARALSRRIEWSTRGGRSGFFRVPLHPHLGSAALLAPADSLIGPVRTPDGWSVFRVAGKRVATDSVDVRARLAKARAKATALARAARVSKHIASLAARDGVRFDYAALRRVDVAQANMVTKRMLGFGGGMLAAPALPPLWEWTRDAAPAMLP